MTQPEAQHDGAMRERSEKVQTALEVTHSQLQQIEEDLTVFLDEYYAAVGASFEELTQLQREIQAVKAGSFGLPPQLQDTAPPPINGKAQPPSPSLKQFYRDLARECHPDSAAIQAAKPIAALKADMMKTLNAAYARKNLSEMWQLKWELERQKNKGALKHAQRLELLRAQQAQMQQTLDELQSRESELKDSAAYKLMLHARLVQSCGQDFTAMVKGRVQRQIDEARRELRAARYQARYWQHVRLQRADKAH